MIGVIQQVGQQWLGKRTFITAVLPMDRAVGVCRALSLMSLSLSFSLSHTHMHTGRWRQVSNEKQKPGVLKALMLYQRPGDNGKMQATRGLENT